MATQVSLVKFVGRIGNIVHYISNNRLVSRTIGKVDIVKMRTAPQYEETRKNQSEFSIATKAGQLFRQGMMHLTRGCTNYAYPVEVMQLMLKTLRADTTQPKGHKQISNGLKNAETQQAFSRLKIYSKRECEMYQGTLLKRSPDQKAWRLNRNLLFGKGINGDQMTVKIGYYHVDFENRVAKYEDALSIACHRNEKIEYSDFILPKANGIGTPWTFVVLQVWREGSIQDVTGMTFMSMLDVIAHEVKNKVTDEENVQKLYTCGLEIEEGHGSHGSHGLQRGKTSKIHHQVNYSVSLMHGHSRIRESMIKIGGQNDWDEVIGKMVVR